MLVSRLHLYRRKPNAAQSVKRPEKPSRPQVLDIKSPEPDSAEKRIEGNS